MTDSFVQISNMFAKEAQACEEDDLECLGNTENSGDGNDDKKTDTGTGANTNKKEGE